MHLRLPLGKRLKRDSGGMFYHSDTPAAREVMYFDTHDDKAEYAAFVRQHFNLKPHLAPDSRWKTWRHWVWHVRQSVFGAV